MPGLAKSGIQTFTPFRGEGFVPELVLSLPQLDVKQYARKAAVGWAKTGKLFKGTDS